MKTMQGRERGWGRLRPVLLPGLLVMGLAACADKTGNAPGTAGAALEGAAPAPVPAGQVDNVAGGETAQAPAPPDAPVPVQPQGITVAVLLADTVAQEGWITVPVQGGVLYINPQPVIMRGDVTDVQAGAGRSGEGLLALGLSAEAQVRLRNLTEQFPDKRLALVVGRNMLAAPAYNAPVSSDRLVFPVGTGQNAAAALHVITAPLEADATPAAASPASVPEPAAGSTPPPQP